MSWVKLDDQFSVNDQVLAAGKDGRELHISALCHCARNLTDGFVKATIVRQLAALFEVYDWQEAVESLISVGLWAEVDGGYQIVSYLDTNPSAESINAKRREAAERQREWRESHRNSDGTFVGEDTVTDEVVDASPEDDSDTTDAVCHTVTNAVTDVVTNNVTNVVTDSDVTSTPRPRPRPRSQIPELVLERAPEPDWPPPRGGGGPGVDPLTARFYGGLQRVGVLVSSAGQAEAYNAIIEDIRQLPQAEQFVDDLMHEAARSTAGRLTPRWFEAVVSRCARDGVMPGAPRSQADTGRADGTARYAGPEVDWGEIARSVEGRG